MTYGDIRLGDTIDIKFTTRRFSTGAPFTLAGSPVISAYVGNGTTEITAGITLTVDFDSRTGLNNVRVVASSGNGFATATNVQLVITAGTVDSVSVVGEVVATFSIENRSALMPTTAARTLDVTAANKVNGVVLADTVTTLTNLPAITANWITAAGITDGAFTAAKFASGAFDAVWTVTTRALSAGAAALEASLQSFVTTMGAAVDVITAAIQGVRDRVSPIVTKTGAVVTDGGNSATTFVTNLTESTNDYWKDSYLRLTSGVLINQVKKITGYNGTTKAITVSGGFTGTPAAGVTFEIVND